MISLEGSLTAILNYYFSLGSSKKPYTEVRYRLQHLVTLSILNFQAVQYKGH